MNFFKRVYRNWKWKRTRHRMFDYLRHEWREDTQISGKYQLTVKRRFQSDELYADLYWVVDNPPEDYPVKEHFSIYRCADWADVEHTIHKIERKIAEGTI